MGSADTNTVIHSDINAHEDMSIISGSIHQPGDLSIEQDKKYFDWSPTKIVHILLGKIFLSLRS